MITLYEGIITTTAPASFTSMPYPLIDAIDCTVTEERNGQFSLVMRYPIGAQYWNKIIPDAIIMASPRPNADPEPFRICKIEQVIEGVVTARANHIVYDLDGIGIINPTEWYEWNTGIDGAVFDLNQAIILQSPLAIFVAENDGIIDTTTVVDFCNKSYASVFQQIGKIAELFNAELKYVWENGYCKIKFCAARGTAKPAVIDYGVNMVSLDRKLDFSGLYSRVITYWLSQNDNTRVEGFANTQYTDRTRFLYIDLTAKYGDTQPTYEQLCADAQAYIDSHDFSPSNELSVEFVPMENTTEHSVPSVPALSDGTPYVYRPSGGSLDLGIRNQETDKVVGGTIAWNQLVQNGDFASTSGWSAQGGSRSVASNKCTLTASGSNPRLYHSFVTDPNHVYLFSAFVTPSVDTESCDIWLYSSGQTITSGDKSISAADRKQVSCIMKPDFASTRIYVRPMRTGAVSGNTFVIENVFCIDLTATFGSLIADYLYALESGTVGAGITKLQSYGFCDKEYYPYHAATLESVNVSAHVMRDSSDNIIGNYALDSNLTLYGILKLDADNNLIYDGDEYNSDGTVIRKYGKRSFTIGDATDGSTMITDGTNTVYKLATPTTETADAFTNPQIVIADGTEQYVDAAYTAGTRDIEMPVGHETIYTFVPEDTSLYLCDTATVDASIIGVSATAKCVKVVYNVITGKYDSVTVGTLQADIVDTILKLGE